MNKRDIIDYVTEELSFEEQGIALDFVYYIKSNEMEFIKDNGYWKDKIYYMIKFNTEFVCFIAIKDPDEKDNHWTVWSDDMESISLEDYPIDKELKEIAWNHVDGCGNCGSCSGGRRKVIFGKEFDKVCGCTFRIDNPTIGYLQFMEKMVEIRKKEILKIL
jgi:hypothetical protein